MKIIKKMFNIQSDGFLSSLVKRGSAIFKGHRFKSCMIGNKKNIIYLTITLGLILLNFVSKNFPSQR